MYFIMRRQILLSKSQQNHQKRYCHFRSIHGQGHFRSVSGQSTKHYLGRHVREIQGEMTIVSQLVILHIERVLIYRYV